MFRRQRELVQNRGLAGRDGARPLQGDRGRTAAGCAWGVASASQIPKWNLGRQSRSSRPTEDGGAGRRVVGPYGWLRKVLSTALGRSPPPKPLCGQADSGERNRSQQRNGNFRPSSSVPGLLQEGGCGPLLGFRRSRRKKAGSFFAAACTRRKILLRPQVWKMAAPMGRPFSARSRPALSFVKDSKAVFGEEILVWSDNSKRNHLLTMSFFMPLVMPSMESWYMSKCFSSSSKVWVQ